MKIDKKANRYGYIVTSDTSLGLVFFFFVYFFFCNFTFFLHWLSNTPGFMYIFFSSHFNTFFVTFLLMFFIFFFFNFEMLQIYTHTKIIHSYLIYKEKQNSYTSQNVKPTMGTIYIYSIYNSITCPDIAPHKSYIASATSNHRTIQTSFPVNSNKKNPDLSHNVLFPKTGTCTLKKVFQKSVF